MSWLPRSQTASTLSRRLPLPHPLREYQWEGATFLASSDAALLADEMGLGKTIQTIVAIRMIVAEGGWQKVLIVVPTALKSNWQRELAEWAPELLTRRVEGTADDRAAYYRLPIPVLIASYEQLRVDVAAFDDSVAFDLVVLDEAQRIKNPEASVALACRHVSRKRSWGLTGTPVENSADDLVALFKFVRPRLLHKGMPRDELHERMQPHFLRRTKRLVAQDLPPILYQDLPLDLAGRQRDHYDEIWSGRRRSLHATGLPVGEANMLALITKLKQACNVHRESAESVKLEALQILLESLIPGDKVLVFSQFVDTLDFIRDNLKGCRSAMYHGGLSEDQRDAVLDEFRSDRGPEVLLVSLRAGGVGLNLQIAGAVILFDRWWNPAVEDQAIQRAHRFGRERPLHVFRFLVADSIEERIADVLGEKRQVFADYVDEADNASVPRLRRDELRKILDLSEVDLTTA